MGGRPPAGVMPGELAGASGQGSPHECGRHDFWKHIFLPLWSECKQLDPFPKVHVSGVEGYQASVSGATRAALRAGPVSFSVRVRGPG